MEIVHFFQTRPTLCIVDIPLSCHILQLNTWMPPQALAVPAIAGGQDTVVAAETGSGKTFAYLAPLISALLARNAAQTASGAEAPQRADRCARCAPGFRACLPWMLSSEQPGSCQASLLLLGPKARRVGLHDQPPGDQHRCDLKISNIETEQVVRPGAGAGAQRGAVPTGGRGGGLAGGRRWAAAGDGGAPVLCDATAAPRRGPRGLDARSVRLG